MRDYELHEVVEASDGAMALVATAMKRQADLAGGGLLARPGTFEVHVQVRAQAGHEEPEPQVRALLGPEWSSRAYEALKQALEAFEGASGRRPTELMLHPEVCAFVRMAFSQVEGVPVETRERSLFAPEAVVVNLAWDEGKSERLGVYVVDPLRELVRAMWPSGWLP